MTFSIVARCVQTGALGVAVSTAVPAVGALCIHVRTGVGAISTQSWVNPYLALGALERLEQGGSAQQALQHVLGSDPAADLRQIGIVDSGGRAAVWTGPQCTDWAGQRNGDAYTIQGNMLTGAATLDAMQRAYEASDGCTLEERLMRALEAGQAAGGDKRGRQSAALTVMRNEAYASVDLRVDEHPEPVAELRRIFEVARLQVAPFVAGMPTRDDPGRTPPPEVTQMLLTPPAQRPGASQSVEQHDAGVLSRWLGADFAAERVTHNLDVYRSILAEISKLRTLDLSEQHPAVVFDLARAYCRSDDVGAGAAQQVAHATMRHTDPTEPR
ncbi:MAG TPA: DUF1028 domain-containing protein [Paraburkholderia sp.]|nr:DUF1028 domain-containing protein [Paraburkholderia sp.]